MNRRPFVRTLLASAAIAAALALAGCETDGTTAKNSKALRPLSDKMLAELERRNMPKESPILIRIFKQESELEVWKQDKSGKFALLKTYPICRWSGELGPKIRTGDRQAPEGFYTITPGQMNPNSQYYLSFNLGYPNAFDRAHGRTGSHLMVHGDCSSAGCYAMTDEQIAEIYALGRESFFGGQRSFQVQAYPFRMTPANLAKHRNNPHMAFWKMLKEGNDHFEVTRLEPKVDVCEKRYVFNATSRGGPFSPTGACPPYDIPDEIEVAVNEKQRRDEQQVAQLINRVTPAPIKTGADGGMHPVFLAKLRPGPMTQSGVQAYTPIPEAAGKLPALVVPPRTVERQIVTASADSDSPEPRASYRVASADSTATTQSTGGSGGGLFGTLFASNEGKSSSDGNVFDRVGRWMGLRGSNAPIIEKPPTPRPKPRPAVVRSANAVPGAIRPRSQETAPAEPPKANPGAIAARPQPPAEPKPAEPKPAEPKTAAVASPATTSSVMPGSTPIVPTVSFDSRWSAFR